MVLNIFLYLVKIHVKYMTLYIFLSIMATVGGKKKNTSYLPLLNLSSIFLLLKRVSIMYFSLVFILSLLCRSYTGMLWEFCLLSYLRFWFFFTCQIFFFIVRTPALISVCLVALLVSFWFSVACCLTLYIITGIFLY